MSAPWLIGCEFSGVVRRAFEAEGIEAWSCDLIPSLDNSPRHIIGDVFEAARSRTWAGAILHPTCRYLTRSGLRWITSPPRIRKPDVLYGEERRVAMEEAIQFVLRLWDVPIEKVAIENPRGVLSVRWRKPDQVVQPWWFGDAELKATAFWKRNLPDLVPTDVVPVEERKGRVHWESAGMKNGLTREQRRSITLPGLAKAYARQWGSLWQR